MSTLVRLPAPASFTLAPLGGTSNRSPSRSSAAQAHIRHDPLRDSGLLLLSTVAIDSGSDSDSAEDSFDAFAAALGSFATPKRTDEDAEPQITSGMRPHKRTAKRRQYRDDDDESADEDSDSMSGGSGHKRARLSSGAWSSISEPVHCAWCFVSNTPQWRRSSDGKSVLCNACGLKAMRKKRVKKD